MELNFTGKGIAVFGFTIYVNFFSRAIVIDMTSFARAMSNLPMGAVVVTSWVGYAPLCSVFWFCDGRWAKKLVQIDWFP